MLLQATDLKGIPQYQVESPTHRIALSQTCNHMAKPVLHVSITLSAHSISLRYEPCGVNLLLCSPLAFICEQVSRVCDTRAFTRLDVSKNRVEEVGG